MYLFVPPVTKAEVISLKVPAAGAVPTTVKTIVAVAAPYGFAFAWVAVIVVLPIETGVNTVPEIVATEGSEDEKLQDPLEFDVGGTKVKFEILERLNVTSPKLPTVGVIKVTVRVVYAVTEFHPGVDAWRALI